MFDAEPDLPIGARPVARLEMLSPDERRLLTLLRTWLEGADGRGAAFAALSDELGREAAERALSAFEAWLEAVAEGARRVLHRCRPACPCVGRDEALLTGAVSAAARGDLEAARALAAETTRPDAVLALLHHARALGLALGAEPARRATLH